MDLNKFFYELDELLAKGKGEEAIAYIQGAMVEARETKDTKALIAIYNEAGGLCRDFSRYEDAENYYTEALSLIIDMGAAGSESHGTTLINYGMVESELDNQMERFAYQLQMSGYSVEQYAKMMGGDMNTLRNAFRGTAEKQAKINVTLEKIAEVEAIEVTEEDINAEIEALAAQYELEVE